MCESWGAVWIKRHLNKRVSRDLNSLTSDTQKLKTTRNVALKNKDGLVITQIMYF